MTEIALIIPNHNHGNELKACLMNLSQQIYSDFEIFLVHHGKDKTGMASAKFAKEQLGLKITEEVIPHDGIKSPLAPINHALTLIKERKDEFKYVSITGADDWVFPNKFLLERNVITSSDNIGAVGSNFLLADDKFNIIRPAFNIQSVILKTRREMITGNSVPDDALIKTECFDYHGWKFTDKYGRNFWWDLWLNIIRNWKILIQPMPVSIYCRKQDSLSLKRPWGSEDELKVQLQLDSVRRWNITAPPDWLTILMEGTPRFKGGAHDD